MSPGIRRRDPAISGGGGYPPSPFFTMQLFEGAEPKTTPKGLTGHLNESSSILRVEGTERVFPMPSDECPSCIPRMDGPRDGPDDRVLADVNGTSDSKCWDRLAAGGMMIKERRAVWSCLDRTAC